MRLWSALAALLSASAVSAQADMVGTARVIDGDTIVVAGEHVRLQGIDAPEMDQTCDAYGHQWPCGRTAAEWLKEYLRGRQVDCVGHARDRYARLLAVCYASGENINDRLVREGWALDYRKYSTDYLEAEAEANAGVPVCGAERSCRPGSGEASAAETCQPEQWSPSSSDETEMRGLTVRHPYAQAIACGLKRIETRGQRVRYRARLAIHAALGQALPLALADLDGVLAECRGSGVDTGAVRASLEAPGSWSFGKIIAVAELSDCVPVEELSADAIERAFGDRASGRFGWRLASVVRLPVPVPARGLQGLWPVKAEIIDIVEQAFVALSRKISI